MVFWWWCWWCWRRRRRWRAWWMGSLGKVNMKGQVDELVGGDTSAKILHRKARDWANAFTYLYITCSWITRGRSVPRHLDTNGRGIGTPRPYTCSSTYDVMGYGSLDTGYDMSIGCVPYLLSRAPHTFVPAYPHQNQNQNQNQSHLSRA